MNVSSDDQPRLPVVSRDTNPVRWVVFGFAGALVLFAASGLFALQTARTVADHGDARERHTAVNHHIHRAFSAVLEVETARRGFILMDDVIYLTPYHEAEPTLEASFAALRKLLADHPERLEAIHELEALIAERLELASRSIELMQEEGYHSEAQKAISPEGHAAMVRVRKQVQNLFEVQDAELARLVEIEERLRARSTAAILTAQALSVVILGIVFLFLVRELRHRAQLQQKVTDAYRELSGSVHRLQERSQQIVRLGEMSDLLHVCATKDEAYHVVSEYAPKLFSAKAGAICLTAASRDQVETFSQWGALEGHAHAFGPQACWALRRGSVHRYTRNGGEVHCGHLTEHMPAGSICYPLVAQNETMGLVHLQYDRMPDDRGDEMRLLRTFVENLGLALANLQLREELRVQATRDALSGLFNRRYMQEAIEIEFRRAERNPDAKVGLIMLDIDHFKQFNDTHGHAAGDTVISEVGTFLFQNVRKGDIPCRYGGEEFVVILPGADKDQTARRAQSLCDGMRVVEVVHDGKSLGNITVSLGVAVFPDDGHDSAALFTSADDALYLAKRQGRDQVVVAGADRSSA